MVVPRNRVNEMVEYLHNLHTEVDIRIKTFGHAGDGNLHSYILRDDLSQEEFERRMELAMEKSTRKQKNWAVRYPENMESVLPRSHI